MKRIRNAVSRITRAHSPRLWEWIRFRSKQIALPEPIAQTGILFIHIPKAAGTSICQALYGIPTIGHLKIRDWQSSFPHSYGKLSVVSVVREPLDRFLSAFYFLKKGGMNELDAGFAGRFLQEFDTPDMLACAMERQDALCSLILKYTHFIPQVDFLQDRKGEIKLDLVVPYEQIGNFGNLIEPFLGRSLSIPRLNSMGVQGKSPLSPESAAFLTSLYDEDHRLHRSLLGGTA